MERGRFRWRYPFDAKVREVVRRVLRSGSEDDQDVYVMSDGRVLKSK